MAAKTKTPAKNAKKAAVELKAPKTPKADKVAVKAKQIETQAQKEDRLKVGLDPALVQKAVEALIKYHEKTSSDSKSLLGNDQPIHVQFTLLRTPEKTSPKPIRVMIPHPLFHLKQSKDDDKILEEPEVCLIVKEESKPWCQEMIERFPEHMGCIKKVLGLQSLRTKHARYEQQLALLHKYNFFIADDRILPMLSKALGKHFYNAKKLPIPISLSRKEALPFAIQNALSATYMSLSKGTCIMIRAGTTAMTPTQLTENIVQIAAGAVPKMPQKWANVQNIAIKTPNSVALPVYNKTPEVLREIAALAGIVQKIDQVEQESKEEEKEETTANTKDAKKAEKKREIQSPLLRALKKQKQGDKEKSKHASSEEAKTTKAKENQSEKKRSSPSDDSKEKANNTPQSSAKKSKKTTDRKVFVDETETPKSSKHASESNAKHSNKEVTTQKSNTKVSPIDKSATTKSPKSPNVNETKKSNKGMETTSPKSSKKASDKNDKKEEATGNKSFIASKKFTGSKKGYVFKMGKEGLGYYVDVKPVVDHMAMDAMTRAAKNNGNRGGPKKGKQQGKRRF